MIAQYSPRRLSVFSYATNIRTLIEADHRYLYVPNLLPRIRGERIKSDASCVRELFAWCEARSIGVRDVFIRPYALAGDQVVNFDDGFVEFNNQQNAVLFKLSWLQ